MVTMVSVMVVLLRFQMFHDNGITGADLKAIDIDTLA